MMTDRLSVGLKAQLPRLQNEVMKGNNLTQWLNPLSPLLHCKFQFNVTITLSRSVIYDTFCTNLKSLLSSCLRFCYYEFPSCVWYCYTFGFMNCLTSFFLLPFFLNFSFLLTHSFLFFLLVSVRGLWKYSHAVQMHI